MKKFLLIPAIFMVMFSACIKAQSNQPKLNQVALSRKLIGVWQEQNAKDTITVWEMSSYKNAILETMFHTINGSKELYGAIIFTFDPQLDRYKGFWIHSNGRVDSYHFKFSSDNEVVFEWVEDFKTNKLLARNKFVFPDPEHLNGTHYNGNEVQYRSSQYVKTSSAGVNAVDMKSTRPEIKSPGLNQLELAKKLIGIWHVEGKRDTIPGLEFEQYGNAIIASDITIINGKKIVRDKVSMGFSKSEDMFKIFFLFPSGGYATRNAYFTSENRIVQEFVENFNPEKLTGKAEFLFDSQTSMTARAIDVNGKITSEAKFTKVK